MDKTKDEILVLIPLQMEGRNVREIGVAEVFEKAGFKVTRIDDTNTHGDAANSNSQSEIWAKNRGMKLDEIVSHLRNRWKELVDRRKPNNYRQYAMADVALSAFSVFFMQSPSFLAHQEAMRERKGRSNLGSMFGVEEMPSSGQIRNLLDGLQPGTFGSDFD